MRSISSVRPSAAAALATFLFAALLLAGCATNQPPVADAGSDQTIRLGETARFDAGGSRDTDGDALTFAWSVAERPDASDANAAPLAGAGSATPTLEPDTTGEYRLALAVSDGTTETTDTVVLTVSTNAAPTVTLGAPATVDIGTTVNVSATASDPDGDPVALAWSLNGRPSGSAATLQVAADGGSASFTADLGGSYGVRVVADDGALSNDDAVAVRAEATVPNRAPTADAGPDVTAEVGDSAPLDGSASSDLDGDSLSATWRVIDWPDGSSRPAPTDPSALVTTLPVAAEGDYVVDLTVGDGTLSDTDRLVIRAASTVPLPDTVVYASPDGDDGATGAAEAPVRSLARALEIAANDPDIDRVELAAGSYPEGAAEPYEYAVADDLDIVGAGATTTWLEPGANDVLEADGSAVGIVALGVRGTGGAFTASGGGTLFVQDVRCEATSCVATSGSANAFIDASTFVGDGSGNGVTGLGGAVSVQNSDLSGFLNGIALLAADASIGASTIDGNTRGINAIGNNVAPVGVVGTTFTSNRTGIAARATSLRLTDVAVRDSERHGIDLDRASADGSVGVRLEVAGNGFSGIRLRGEELTLDDGDLRGNGVGSPDDATDRAGLRIESGTAFVRGTQVRNNRQDNVAVLGGLFDAAQADIRGSNYAGVYATNDATVRVDDTLVTAAFNGFYVTGSATVEITDSVLSELGNDGVFFGSDGSLTVRGSTVRNADDTGVTVGSAAAGAAIDLGTPADPGGNTFEDASSLLRYALDDQRPGRSAADGPILAFYGNRLERSGGVVTSFRDTVNTGPATRDSLWRIDNTNQRLRD